MVPKLPAWADPDTQSVTDPLWSTLVKKAMGALGANDPASQAMGVAAPMSIVGSEGAKLEPFLVQMYKQRLRMDPSLAYHPGLQQVPEFQAAFSELFPTKKIVGPGQSVSKSTYQVMKETPPPPAVRGADELPDVTPTLGKKTPRTVTIREMRASDGKPANPNQGRTVNQKYDPRSVADDFANWKGTQAEYSRAKGINEGTLRDILIRMQLAKERGEY